MTKQDGAPDEEVSTLFNNGGSEKKKYPGILSLKQTSLHSDYSPEQPMPVARHHKVDDESEEDEEVSPELAKLEVLSLNTASIKRLRKIFSMYDALRGCESDGTLRQEVLCFSGRCVEILEKMDFDDDGSINFQEFQCFFVSLLNSSNQLVPDQGPHSDLGEWAGQPMGEYRVEAWMQYWEQHFPVVKERYSAHQESLYGPNWSTMTAEQKSKHKLEVLQSEHRSCCASSYPDSCVFM